MSLEIKDCAFPSVDQWRITIKGMRNALKSWSKSDSIVVSETPDHYRIYESFDIEGNAANFSYIDLDDPEITETFIEEHANLFVLGVNDAKLLKGLSRAGSSDRKALRMLGVTLEIKAPLKWWDQMDQYKIGTVTNSTSQMHTLLKDEFKIEDFDISYNNTDYFTELVKELNELREFYLKETIDAAKLIKWNTILERIPQSYFYTRTWHGSYENLINIYFQRRNHKYEPWRIFCKWLLENVPYFKKLVEVIESGLS